MNDALLMRGFERFGDLPGVVHRRLQRNRPGEIFAFDELHHQVVRADVVQRADVGMIQRSDRPGLAFEALRKLFPGDFQRDDAVQTRVAGFVHFPHAARADQIEYLVGAELRAGGERHGLRYFAPRAHAARVFQSGSSLDANWRPPLWKSSPPETPARGCFSSGLCKRFDGFTNFETRAKFWRDCSSVQLVAPLSSGWRKAFPPLPAWHTTQRAWPSRFLRKIGSTLER